jgi:hypothetical protein
LYFHELNGANFLRAHSPEKYSDQIARNTLKNAMESASVSVGIEFGTFGLFVLRVVIPWVINDQMVGYIELGEEIDHILEHISTRHINDFILTIDKDYIYREELENTEFFLLKKAQLLDASNLFVIHQTIDELDDELFGVMDSGDGINSYHYQRDGADYLISKIKILDFDQSELASIFYLLDVTKSSLRKQAFYQKMFLTILVSSLILILFYIVYSGRLQLLLSSTINDMKREIGDREAVQKALVESKSQLEGLVKERNYSLDESRKRYKTLFEKTADALLITHYRRESFC